jgi:hypothetical protein
MTPPFWINPDPRQPALADPTPIDTGTARSAALCTVCAIGFVLALALVLP